jgi:Fe2+ transport protein
VDISPAQVQAGSLNLSLSMDRARHMLDQSTSTATDTDPAHQATEATATAANATHQQNSTTASAAGSTAFVLQGLLQLTNNFTPAQQVPDDQPQSMFRHVSVQIRSGAAEQSVPYLSASMDVLLDGHPVIANVPLLPMVDAEAAPVQLYYGNNVKLTQRGDYQVFVRILPNVLLGKEPVPAAQFNVGVH